jgi:hypothetical protein
MSATSSFPRFVPPPVPSLEARRMPACEREPRVVQSTPPEPVPVTALPTPEPARSTFPRPGIGRPALGAA